MNNVRVYVYNTDGSYLPIMGIENVRYSTIYNGGYGDCTFDVIGDQSFFIQPNYRVQVRNGLTIVWDGLVSGVVRNPARGRGVSVQAQGHFAAYLDRRSWAKQWATADVSQNTWKYRTTSTGDGLGSVKRDGNRLFFTPDGGKQWANTEAIVCDIFPTDGETIKRIAFSYDFQEGAQAWELQVQDVTNAVTLFSATASGTGTQNITLGTPSSQIFIGLRSAATQTPAEGIYAEVTDLVVYTETGDIDATAIAEDIAGYVTELNSTSDIDDISVDLTPFSFDRATPLNKILSAALSYGDASFNTYAYGIRPPQFITTADPQLFVEAYPDTTDYDYDLSIDDLNLLGDFKFSRDVSDVVNYVRVTYTDADGSQQVVTPADNANLTDTDSSDEWGRRDGDLVLTRVTNEANAVLVGRRYLANKKDPQWKLDSPIKVQGYIHTKSGARLPASAIQAGKRIRLRSNIQTFDAWIFVISRTRYDDDSQTCIIEIGEPITFDILLAQLARRNA